MAVGYDVFDIGGGCCGPGGPKIGLARSKEGRSPSGLSVLFCAETGAGLSPVLNESWNGEAPAA
jgi:hypothetical protein